MVQEKLYPCLSADVSIQTACHEILKNVFTTEQRDDDGDDNDDGDDSDACSIATDSTRKTRNSVPSPPTILQTFQQIMVKDENKLLFTAENAAELQYRCNQRAQRIQRAYERGLKSSAEHARHLHERYGNRATTFR